MDTSSNTALSELRERVIASHRDYRPLQLRGAGTKDFYGETLPGEALDAELLFYSVHLLHQGLRF